MEPFSTSYTSRLRIKGNWPHVYKIDHFSALMVQKKLSFTQHIQILYACLEYLDINSFGAHVGFPIKTEFLCHIYLIFLVMTHYKCILESKSLYNTVSFSTKINLDTFEYENLIVNRLLNALLSIKLHQFASCLSLAINKNLEKYF